MRNLLNKFIDLLNRTPIEIYIGIVLGGLVAGLWTNNKEQLRAQQIPVAFSEIEAITQDFNHRSEAVWPLTKYYCSVNEISMKVWESSNLAYDYAGGGHERLASELELRVADDLKVHKTITDYKNEFVSENGTGDRAMDALAPLPESESLMEDIVEALDNAWNDSHTDVSHTETRTRTTYEQQCEGEDSNRTCQTVEVEEEYEVEVYDYTIHKYTYDKEQGRLAAKLLQDFFRRYPDLSIDEDLYTVDEVGPDNEYAMERSRRHRKKLEKVLVQTQGGLVELSQLWAASSHYKVYMPRVTGNHRNLEHENKGWQSAYRGAKTTKYTTTSSYDAGPEDFRIVERALEYAVSLHSSSTAITNGVRYANKQVPVLEQKINEYVDVVLDGAPGNPDRLKKEIMSISKELIDKNFQGGHDITMYPYDVGNLVLWTVIGMAVGGLLGGVTNEAINRNPIRRRREEDDFTPRY